MRLFVAFLFVAAPAMAASPIIQTQGPVIYLANNLDEKDNLGWCIDTLGRGFAERLQAHSCKPRGGDVQFSYDSNNQQIRSVAFSEFCMSRENQGASTLPFGLVMCDKDAITQKFDFVTSNGQIRYTKDPSLCVSVGRESRMAGPFMSRDLLLEPCNEVAPEFSSWVVRRE